MLKGVIEGTDRHKDIENSCPTPFWNAEARILNLPPDIWIIKFCYL